METEPVQPASASGKLSLALSKAQGKFGVPKKTKLVDFQPDRGPRVKYKYADLADVIEAIRAPLAENELSISHFLEYSKEGMYGLRTTLSHSSGAFIDSFYPLPDPMKETIRAQAFGSALTYARRYSLSALVGIASDEDDDGQGAPETTPPGAKPGPKPKGDIMPPPPPLPEDDLDSHFPPDEPGMTPLEQLYALVDDRGMTAEAVKVMIKRITGRAKKSTELSDIEIKGIIKLIELS